MKPATPKQKLSLNLPEDVVKRLKIGVLVAGVRDFGCRWRPCRGLGLNGLAYPSRPRASRVAA